MSKKFIIILVMISNFILAQEENKQNVEKDINNNETQITDTLQQAFDDDTTGFVPSYLGLENLTTLGLFYGAGVNNAFMNGMNIKFGGNYIEDSWDLYLGIFYGLHSGNKKTEHSKFADNNGQQIVYLDSTYNYKSSYYGLEIGFSIIKNQKEVIRPYMGLGITNIKNDYLSVRTGVVNTTTKNTKTITPSFFVTGITFLYNLDDILNAPLSVIFDMNYKVIGGDYGRGTGFVNMGINYKLNGLFE